MDLENKNKMKMKNKLSTLAEVAAEFYGVPLEKLKSPSTKAAHTKPRQTCQWVADDAGYTKSDVARFWKRDRASIYCMNIFSLP